MKKSLEKLLTSSKGKKIAEKVATIDDSTKEIVLDRIDAKIEKLNESGLTSKEMYEKVLGNLLAYRDLFVSQ